VLKHALKFDALFPGQDLLHTRLGIAQDTAIILPEIIKNRLHLLRLRRRQAQFLLHALEEPNLSRGRIEIGLVERPMRAQGHYERAGPGAEKKYQEEHNCRGNAWIPAAAQRSCAYYASAHRWPA